MMLLFVWVYLKLHDLHAHKKDSYVDLAAYAAIAGEIEERTDRHISFESKAEKKGRETRAYIKSLQKDKK